MQHIMELIASSIFAALGQSDFIFNQSYNNLLSYVNINNSIKMTSLIGNKISITITKISLEVEMKNKWLKLLFFSFNILNIKEV